MQSTNPTTKLETTVVKTIDALARIERFVTKYGPSLSENQITRISTKLKELQKQL